MTYLYFAAAIVSEVVATSALKASEQFTKLTPSLIVIIGYCISFYLVTIVLRTIPVGITYAIWAGVGIVLVALVGAILYKQIPDIPAVIGMGLIVAGVVIINVYSKNDNDPRADLYRAIKATDWVLIDFHQETKTLESIFRELTREN